MTGRQSTVFFTDLRATRKRNLLDKLDGLLDAAGVKGRFKKGHLVAIKLHFGEKGNTSYIQPVFVRRVADRVRETGAKPFLTDTNTLYVGTRGNSVDHLKTAIEHGFNYAVVAAPVVIADGLRGEYSVPVRVVGGRLNEVHLAGEVVNASGLVVLTHFKCHEISGFGGAIKNVGMGCASRLGKLAQHSTCAPVVEPAGCVACGECAAVCPAGAIDIGRAAFIDEDRCVGCSRCISACPEGTITIRWNETSARVQEKMAEYAKGALAGKEDKSVFVNFVTRVSPACDCYGHNDAPVTPDAGMLASVDPVAIDQASADLVNALPGHRESALRSGHEAGGDKFRGVYPEVDWQVQLRSAEALGLGTRKYRLERLS